MDITIYTKLAFGYRACGTFWMHAIGRNANSNKPYAVYCWEEPNGKLLQISPNYKYRGWAERSIKKIHKNSQKTFLQIYKLYGKI